MSIPFKALYEFQTSQGCTMVFNKNDPRVDTLNFGDTIIVKDKLYKLVSTDSISYFMNKMKKTKDEIENYRAFVVQLVR